jgi:signal transduction histidine kinase
MEKAEEEMGRGAGAEEIDWVQLARLRHDVRTPLNAVLGIANILPASGPFTSRQEEMIAALKSSAAHLHERIEDLFSFLQPGGIRPAPRHD